MTLEKYLLMCASEECIEISKELHKSLRFGLKDKNPEKIYAKSNEVKIALEFADLMAVLELLKENYILDFDKIFIENDINIENEIKNKKVKVMKYFEYANNKEG